MLIFRMHGKIWFNVLLLFYWMHGSDREKFSPIVNQQGFDCVQRGPKMGQERSNQKDFEKKFSKKFLESLNWNLQTVLQRFQAIPDSHVPSGTPKIVKNCPKWSKMTFLPHLHGNPNDPNQKCLFKCPGLFIIIFRQNLIKLGTFQRQ